MLRLLKKKYLCFEQTDLIHTQIISKQLKVDQQSNEHLTNKIQAPQKKKKNSLEHLIEKKCVKSGF